MIENGGSLFEIATNMFTQNEFPPIPDILPIDGLTIRYTIPQDIVYLKKWLADPDAIKAYPMCTGIEIDDAARRWVSFSRFRSSLTIEYHGIPVGIATLHIHWYKQLSHQCDFAIIIDPIHRNRGFGSFLLNSVIKLGKRQFLIDYLHLQVFQDNPAIHLYKRFGFMEFGVNPAWTKNEEQEYLAVLYMGRRV